MARILQIIFVFWSEIIDFESPQAIVWIHDGLVNLSSTASRSLNEFNQVPFHPRRQQDPVWVGNIFSAKHHTFMGYKYDFIIRVNITGS